MHTGTSPRFAVRPATDADIPEIVRITNRAYVVEHLLIRGDRTDPADVSARMQSGKFLVIEDAADRSILRGSVFMSIADGRGYLGILSVEPQRQGSGMARSLITAVEDECRHAGCHFLDISVINVREELFPFYTRLGFFPSAILPFPRPETLLQPLHLVQMVKPLRAVEEL